MINYKKLTAAMAAGIIAIFTITGCAMPWQKAADDSSSNVSTVSAGNLSQSGENALSLEFDSEDLDSSYNESECTKINLSGSGATVSGSGVTVENGNITITSVGSYIISGTLTDGSIKVNCSEKGTVRLILNGASISSSSTAPVVVEELSLTAQLIQLQIKHASLWMTKIFLRQFIQKQTLYLTEAELLMSMLDTEMVLRARTI